MKAAHLAKLRIISLTFLLPGLAGLILSATVSVHYLETFPRFPAPQVHRTVPRNIHGTVVYQTVQEDVLLNLIEFSSVGVFLTGFSLGLVYLEKWGARQARVSEEDETLTENMP